MLTHNFLWDLICGPSYSGLLLPVPLYLVLSFGCALQSGQEWLLIQGPLPPVSHAGSKFAWLCHRSLHILKVMYSFCAGESVPFLPEKPWLSTCYCNKNYLKQHIIHSPFPHPSPGLWRISSRTPDLHPVTLGQYIDVDCVWNWSSQALGLCGSLWVRSAGEVVLPWEQIKTVYKVTHY